MLVIRGAGARASLLHDHTGLLRSPLYYACDVRYAHITCFYWGSPPDPRSVTYGLIRLRLTTLYVKGEAADKNKRILFLSKQSGSVKGALAPSKQTWGVWGGAKAPPITRCLRHCGGLTPTFYACGGHAAASLLLLVTGAWGTCNTRVLAEQAPY